jgi:hypothetical protein
VIVSWRKSSRKELREKENLPLDKNLSLTEVECGCKTQYDRDNCEQKTSLGIACHSFHCWHGGVRAVEVGDAGNKSCHKLQVLQGSSHPS